MVNEQAPDSGVTEVTLREAGHGRRFEGIALASASAFWSRTTVSKSATWASSFRGAPGSSTGRSIS